MTLFDTVARMAPAEVLYGRQDALEAAQRADRDRNHRHELGALLLEIGPEELAHRRVEREQAAVEQLGGLRRRRLELPPAFLHQADVLRAHSAAVVGRAPGTNQLF